MSRKQVTCAKNIYLYLYVIPPLKLGNFPFFCSLFQVQMIPLWKFKKEWVVLYKWKLKQRNNLKM